MSQNLAILKNGDLVMNSGYNKFLVNNFTQTGTTTGWTFGGTSSISNGIVTLVGSNPSIYSAVFNVGANDIICVEMTIALPVPSDPAGSSKGLYIGTTSGQAVYVHSFNTTSLTWTQSSSTTTNPYFFNAYNLATPMIRKDFILGTSASLADVPFGETTNTSFPPKAIQLSGTQSTIRLRSGYNSNPSMTISLANFKIYNIREKGFSDFSTKMNALLGRNWGNANEFIEL